MMDSATYFATLSEIVDRFVTQDDFWSCEVEIPASELSSWICMRQNPKHFTPGMFLGKWSLEGKHPQLGPIRLVRAMSMPDDSLRVIGRQGENLFVLILELPSQ